MSVQIVETSAYNYLFSGLIYAAHLNVCTDLFSSTIRQHFEHMGNDQIHDESLRLVMSWADLNERSYDAKYSETSMKLCRHIKGVSSYLPKSLQMLMLIKSVIYNIEFHTIKAKGGQLKEKDLDDLHLLKAWEIDVMNAIISSLPDWDKMQWGKYDPNKK